MALIQSGASATQWTIDPTSDAGRVTIYDQYGNVMSDVHSLSNVLNALNDDVTIVLGGQATLGIAVEGTTGSLTLSFEATIDSTTWFDLSATPVTGGSVVTSTTGDGQWVASTSGFYAIRARVSAFTSGSMTVSAVITPNQSKFGAQAVNFAGGVDQGNPNTLANAWSVEITDGTDVLGTAAHPIRTDPTGTTTQPISIVGTIPVTVENESGNIDAGNSSTTPLSGSATFTGTGIDTTGYATIGVSAFADESGTLKLQFSSDNTNWDQSILYSVAASNFVRVTTGPQARYFRVMYVNGGSVQTIFRLQTTEKPVASYPSTVPIDTVIDASDDAILTKSVITGKTTGGGGGYVDVKVHPSGTLVVDASNSSGVGVSGTVTSDQGNPNSIGNSWPVEVTDGTNILGTNPHPIRIDPTGTTTQPISGTITANQGGSPWGIKTEVELDYDTGAGTQNLSIIGLALPASGGAVAGGTATNPIRIDPIGTTTQPISGTITANAGTGTFAISAASLPLPTGAATEVTLGTRLADATFTGRINTLGQKTMANSTPIVIASDQTAVPASQSGIWTVQPGNTANTTPWLITINQSGNSAAVTGSNALKVDGSAVTQPVSGTITANIGTTNGLALDSSVSGLSLSQGSTTSGEKGILTQGAVTTAAPIYTNAQTSPLSLTTSGALRIDGSAVTQPVSGTITANIGTSGALALDATLTGGTQTTRVTDGTNTATVKAASTAAVVTDKALVVAVSPNNSVAVTGTVTSNIGTTNGLALDATLTGGTQTTRITDGTNTATVKAASTAAVATDKALVVALSPNNSLTTSSTLLSDRIVSGTITALNGTQLINTQGIGDVGLTITGSWTATLSFQGSIDGTNWFDIQAMPSPVTSSSTTSSSTVTNGQFTIPAAGLNEFRVIATAFTSGAATITLEGNQGSSTITGVMTVQQTTAANLNTTAKITDGTNTAAVKAASTTPLVADPALVVSLSPNSSTNSGIVSSVNSSTATLSGAAVFTGTSESTLGFESISITVMAIGASAPPGTLSVQQSSNGTNWDVQDSFSVTGGTASPTGEFDIIVPLVASNFRIVYTNGATAQTAFRLQTVKWAIKTSVPNAVQKGVQPASSIYTATQSAKDSGRVIKIFAATATAGVTTEAMMTLTPLTDFTAGGTGTSFTITTGKRFRIQSFSITIKAGAATASGALVRLRISASGAVTTATAVAATVASLTSNISGISSSAFIDFPDGLELSGTMQLGVSQLSSITSATLDVQVIGYEY